MAKESKKQNEGKSTKITTPSQFGSHKSMVVKELDNQMVICRDDTHEYITYRSRLDSGLADPRRYS